MGEKKKVYADYLLQLPEVFCEETNLWTLLAHNDKYYTANGWKVGRNPMKDWQAAVRQWEQRRKQETPNPRPFPRQQQESVYQRNARAFAEFQNRLNIQYADEQ